MRKIFKTIISAMVSLGIIATIIPIYASSRVVLGISGFSDVSVGYKYAKAIETLSHLNIFTGDDLDGDGIMSFRPDDNITRAEFAALIIRIQGFEGSVMANTATVFDDVPSSHWASGYISQAANQGIVNGYGDGNFGPEDTVKYEEAIKMIISTLGYEPYAKQQGGYPYGYIEAADKFGVHDNVMHEHIGASATRGSVAQLLYNAIYTPLMGQSRWSGSGIVEYTIYDGKNGTELKTLATEYLGITADVITGSEDPPPQETAIVYPPIDPPSPPVKTEKPDKTYDYVGQGESCPRCESTNTVITNDSIYGGERLKCNNCGFDSNVNEISYTDVDTANDSDTNTSNDNDTGTSSRRKCPKCGKNGVISITYSPDGETIECSNCGYVSVR